MPLLSIPNEGSRLRSPSAPDELANDSSVGCGTVMVGKMFNAAAAVEGASLCPSPPFGCPDGSLPLFCVKALRSIDAAECSISSSPALWRAFESRCSTADGLLGDTLL
jgi:hypothetical protein